jgi:hypothetical protein
MSWSRTVGPTAKDDLGDALDATAEGLNEQEVAQHEACVEAAMSLVDASKADMFSVSLSGHVGGTPSNADSMNVSINGTYKA